MMIIIKIAAKTVVGFIVWMVRRLKKPRSREMSARGYALHSVCTQFLSVLKPRNEIVVGMERILPVKAFMNVAIDLLSILKNGSRTG